jgi:hypothetical protein
MSKAALCVGINNYPGTGSDLHGCINDANAWAARFNSRGFTTDVLLDEEATWERMTRSIEQVVAGAGAGDTVVITFSGHGSYVPDIDGDEFDDERDEVICPYDISKNRPLTDDQLYDLFSDRQGDVRTVLIADSCHSGSVARLAPPLGEAEPPERIRFLPPSVFLPQEDITGLRGVGLTARPRQRKHEALLLAGCRDTETSADAFLDGRPCGAFSFYALEALDRVDEGATYLQWMNAIRQLLPNQRFSQHPTMQGSRTQKNWPVF